MKSQSAGLFDRRGFLQIAAAGQDGEGKTAYKKDNIMSPSFALRKCVAIFVLVFLVDVILIGESQAGDYLPWRAYVIECVDTLIEHGRDEYGPIQTDMLMSIIDVDTLRSPSKPLWLDSEAYYAIGRAHRRSMRGSNFWYDRAKTIANWHWRHRHPEALLVGDDGLEPPTSTV